MEPHNYLSQNLRAYQKLKKLSLAEFSRELDIPQSTLKSILKDGNTTLETVIRISRRLDSSLDLLVYDRNMPDKLFILHHMEQSGAWFAANPPEAKETMACHMARIWEVMGK